MKKLKDLFKDTDLDVKIKDIKINSKEIEKGDLFVCTKGISTDRHDFIDEAIANGAAALVVSKGDDYKVPYIKVKDVDAIAEDLFRRFYDDPQKELKIIGITGTDGKTSSSIITQTLLGDDKCGYIGSSGYFSKYVKGETVNTTPSFDKLYKIFREFKDSGCEYVVMEASSEAFYYGRLKNLTFDYAAYTNVTSEHMYVHKTMENYANCKKQLFLQLRDGSYGVLNKDDAYYEMMKEAAKISYSYGYEASADLYIKDYHLYPNKTEITFVYEGKEYAITSPLLGKFNIENLALALLLVLKMGYPFEMIASRIKDVKVDGRMQVVDAGQDYHMFVDFAHTANAVKRLLEFVDTVKINKKIAVIGLPGHRDIQNRKDIGRILCERCDHVIFTMHNPKDEPVEDIIAMMIEDVKDNDKYEIIYDRKEAIQKAVSLAKKDDLVMILGRGSYTEMKVKDGHYHFVDYEEALKAAQEKLNKVL